MRLQPSDQRPGGGGLQGGGVTLCLAWAPPAELVTPFRGPSPASFPFSSQGAASEAARPVAWLAQQVPGLAGLRVR